MFLVLAAAEKGDSQEQNETTDSNDQARLVKATRARGRSVEQLDTLAALLSLCMF